MALLYFDDRKLFLRIEHEDESRIFSLWAWWRWCLGAGPCVAVRGGICGCASAGLSDVVDQTCEAIENATYAAERDAIECIDDSADPLFYFGILHQLREDALRVVNVAKRRIAFAKSMTTPFGFFVFDDATLFTRHLYRVL